MTANITVYIYTLSPKTPDFEFDFTTDVSKDVQYGITEHPVENSGNVSDHIYRKPFVLNTEGAVAITPISPRTFQPTPSTDPTVLKQMQKSLEELADKMDLVNVVCDLYTGPAAISAIRFSKGVEDGQSMRASISLRQMTIGKTQTSAVDPSRLKRKVKRKQDGKGGAPATEQSIKDAQKKQLKASLGLFGRSQSRFSSATGG